MVVDEQTRPNIIFTMTSLLVSLIFSAAVQAIKLGITTVYEARKLRRPSIMDKEGTRAWLENTLKWIAYVQRMFFQDLHTMGYTVAVLMELVKQGEKWDALYAAILHDFNIPASFPPNLVVDSVRKQIDNQPSS